MIRIGVTGRMFFSGTGLPRWSQTKGCKIVVAVVVVVVVVVAVAVAAAGAVVVVVGWGGGGVIHRMNKVTLCWSRLVLEWVTFFTFTLYHLRM